MTTCKVLLNKDVMVFTIKNDAISHSELRSAMNFTPTHGGFLEVVQVHDSISLDLCGESVSCNLTINEDAYKLLHGIMGNEASKLYVATDTFNRKEARIYALSAEDLTQKDPVDFNIEFDNLCVWEHLPFETLGYHLDKDYNKLIYG